MRKFIPIVFFAVITFVSCNFFSPEEEKTAVARVGNAFLYQEDLSNFSFISEEDSINKVKSYIDSWIKEQLLLQKALDNLNQEQSNFEEQLKNYKNSLLIYAFENQIVKQKLDTSISTRECLNYYNNNRQNFKLNETIVKCIFIQFLSSAPKQDSLNTWIKSADYSDKLLQYCTQFASNCHLDTSKWISANKVKELVAFPLDDKELFTTGEKKIGDSLQTIVLKVYNVKRKDDIAPLKYVEEKIESIILNKRKIQLIAKVKEEIMEEATLKEKYEIYN